MTDKKVKALYADDPEEYQDEAYFDDVQDADKPRVFDTELLRAPVTALRMHKPILLAEHHTATEAMRAMKGESCGEVLITEDGTAGTKLTGIFTERDVLFKIVDGGRNPATLALGEVMTREVASLKDTDPVSEVLLMMSVGGFRHVPVVDDAMRPLFVVSVKDVVQFFVSTFSREILNRGDDRTQQREGG